MSDTRTAKDELTLLETNPDLMRARDPSLLVHARGELLAADEGIERVALLSEWVVEFPRAASRLLVEGIYDKDFSAEIASTVIACEIIDADLKDRILAAAFPRLEVAIRDAAADRPGVRTIVRLEPNVGYVSVPKPDPTWLWPVGVPFPPVDSVAGIQARLNYLDLGAGPPTGMWNDATARAFVRFQVLNALEPSGEQDFESAERLALLTPESP